MESLNYYMNIYYNEVEKGDIVKAYQGLMKYMMNLRIHFKSKFPEYIVSGSVYQGYMDMSYFSFTPKSLNNQKLKIAIIFNHEMSRFEIWLVARNKNIQASYFELFKNSKWEHYNVPKTIKKNISILEYVLIEKLNFNDLNSLTNKIEKETFKFIEDIEMFLNNQIE